MKDSYIDGAWRVVRAIDVRVGTAWKRVNRSEVYIGGAWKTASTFAPPMSASAFPTMVYSYTSGGGSSTTDASTVTPSGGVAPYTYSWANISGDGLPVSPTAATTTFNTNVSNGGEKFGTFRCTVTDSLGSTATADASASFIDFGGFF